MATTLGGVTLAEPKYGLEGMDWSQVDVGAMHNLADGSKTLDYVSSSWDLTLRWTGITTAQMWVIRNQFTAALSDALAFVDTYLGSSITVFGVPGSFKRSVLTDGSGTDRWDVEIQLTEQS